MLLFFVDVVRPLFSMSVCATVSFLRTLSNSSCCAQFINLFRLCVFVVILQFYIHTEHSEFVCGKLQIILNTINKHMLIYVTIAVYFALVLYDEIENHYNCIGLLLLLFLLCVYSVSFTCFFSMRSFSARIKHN